MRRRLTALAGAVVLLVLTTTTACTGGRPDGVDGDLTNGWAPLPAAVQFHPADHVCHTRLIQTAPLKTYDPVGCDERHLAETFAVGELTGTVSATDSRDAIPQAYASCSKQAQTFLGGDWRTGWLIVQPVLPGVAGWRAGARWFRCDATETSPVDGSLVARTASLRGALTAGTRLRMSCVDPKVAGEQVTEMHPIDCTRVHTAEFAGLWVADVVSPSRLTSAAMAKGCNAAIARFAAVPDDGDLESRAGWLGFPPDDTSWDTGDHSIRCFLWLNGEKMTGSYRNAGTGKLTIHYVSR